VYTNIKVVIHLNKWIVNAAQMRKFDQLTLKRYGLEEIDLMKKVGTILCHYTLDYQLVTSQDEIIIIAGVGNNGGDALVMAMEYIDKGFTPTIWLIGDLEHQSDGSKKICALLKKTNSHVSKVNSTEQLDALVDDLDVHSVCIDGLFGIGVTRPLKGIYAEVVEVINQQDFKVISVDMPSGIHADCGLIEGHAVHANDTLVIQTFKQGHVLNDGFTFSGNKHLIDVGIVGEYTEDETVLIAFDYYKRFLPKRNRLYHKYDYGHILCIGGSKGMMGAPQLSAYAAMRSGSGLASILYRDIDKAYIPSYYPEIMVDTFSGLASITDKITKKNAIVFGVGLPSDDTEYKEILNSLLKGHLPLVIDATGLKYYSDLKDQFPLRGNIVLTPHAGELARFLNISVEELMKSPVLYIKNIAHKYNATVILKGPVTIITNDLNTYFVEFATAGLATAGSGDVLSGIIASYLGQGLSPIQAALCGVSVHSHAGNGAKERFGETAMMATDVIEQIPVVLKD
jgi:NAD(P)H-hydrate epimerase